MKNIFSILSFLMLSINFSKAQATKGLSFSLKVVPSIQWYWGGGEMIKSYQKVFRFSGGIEISKSYKNIALTSGILIETSGGKVKYENYGTPRYNNTITSNANHIEYLYDESENKILYENFYDGLNIYINGTNKNLRLFQLNEREYKLSYITIPLLIVFKEKLPLDFNGIVGVNSSFLLTAKAVDNVTSIDIHPILNNFYLGESKDLSNLDIKKDVNPFLFKLNLGISKNRILTDKLSLSYGINYLISLSKPLTKYSNEIVYEKIDLSLPQPYQEQSSHIIQKVSISSISLNLGLQF